MGIVDSQIFFRIILYVLLAESIFNTTSPSDQYCRPE